MSILLKIFIVPLEIHKHTMVLKKDKCGNDNQTAAAAQLACRKLLDHPMTFAFRPAVPESLSALTCSGLH